MRVGNGIQIEASLSGLEYGWMQDGVLQTYVNRGAVWRSATGSGVGLAFMLAKAGGENPYAVASIRVRTTALSRSLFIGWEDLEASGTSDDYRLLDGTDVNDGLILRSTTLSSLANSMWTYPVSAWQQGYITFTNPLTSSATKNLVIVINEGSGIQTQLGIDLVRRPPGLP